MSSAYKQPHGTRVADIRKLQQIMHYHGIGATVPCQQTTETAQETAFGSGSTKFAD